jgi:HSP20 family protein
MLETVFAPWAHFDGLEDVERLRRRFDKLFNDHDRERVAQAAGPRANVFDTGSSLLFEVELPGFTSDNLQITVDKNIVTLAGERKAEAREGYSVHRRERSAMKFSRSFNVATPIDVEKVSASLKDGILTLVLPRAVENQPRQITIQAR